MNKSAVKTNIILVSNDKFLENILKQIFASVHSYLRLPLQLKASDKHTTIVLDLESGIANIADLYRLLGDNVSPTLVITDSHEQIVVQHPLVRFAIAPVHPKILYNQIQNLQEIAKNFYVSTDLGGGLSLYTNQNEVKDISGNVIARLTSKEQDLLLYLVKNGKSGIKREIILQEVWGKQYVDTKTLESHIASIRNKLGTYAKYLQIGELGYYWHF